MEKEKKTKDGKNYKQVSLLCSVLLLITLSFLNQLLSGYQKDHVFLSTLKLHEDNCLCTNFPIKKFGFGWTQTPWRVFYRDLIIKCALKSGRLSYFGTSDLKLLNSLDNFKHKLKEHFFKKLRNMEQDIFAY